MFEGNQGSRGELRLVLGDFLFLALLFEAFYVGIFFVFVLGFLSKSKFNIEKRLNFGGHILTSYSFSII